LVVDLNYFSFSHPNPNPIPTHLHKHEFLSPKISFISVFGMYSITVCMRSLHWYEVRNFASQKFRLRAGCCPTPEIVVHHVVFSLKREVDLYFV